MSEDEEDIQMIKRIFAMIPDNASRALTILAAVYGTACANSDVSDGAAYEGLRLSLLSGRRKARTAEVVVVPVQFLRGVRERLRYDGDLFHDQGAMSRAEASWAEMEAIDAMLISADALAQTD